MKKYKSPTWRQVSDIAIEIFVVSGVFSNLIIWFTGVYNIIKYAWK